VDLRHLRYFVAIVEEGGFSQAARGRLHTSQPSLSRQVRQLEAELGVTLLDRRAGGAVPTAAGRVFLDHARKILRQVEEARAATRGAHLVLRVGCLAGLEPLILPRLRALVDRVRQSISPNRPLVDPPEVDVQLVSASSPRLHQDLRDGRLEMAFLRQDDDLTDVCYVTIYQHEIVAVLPADHWMAGAHDIPFERIGDVPYIAVSDRAAPVLSTTIEAWGRRRGLALTPAHVAANIASAVSLIQSTGGFALVPDYVHRLIPRDVAIVRMSDGPPPLPLTLARRAVNLSEAGVLVEAIAAAWAEEGFGAVQSPASDVSSAQA
jgi:LysR family hca operon transcriptional activator